MAASIGAADGLNLRHSVFCSTKVTPLSVDPTLFAHQLRPGDAYASLEFRVSAELNQQFLFALEDYRAEYLGSSSKPAAIHPALLLHMSARTRSPSFRLAPGVGSVFAKDVVAFVGRAVVDEPLTVHWTIRDVYEKRGRLYQALDTRVVNGAGKEVLRREAHSVFYADSSVTLVVPTSATVAAR